MITIEGNPISVNALYRGRRFLTNEGKAMKMTYRTVIWRQWKQKPIEGPVEIIIRLFFKNKKRRDIDGPLKALLDAMTGIVYEDDSQIMDLHVHRSIGEPRVEISVIPLSTVPLSDRLDALETC